MFRSIVIHKALELARSSRRELERAEFITKRMDNLHHAGLERCKRGMNQLHGTIAGDESLSLTIFHFAEHVPRARQLERQSLLLCRFLCGHLPQLLC